MKKILSFVKSFLLIFVLHFLVSLLFNYLFHDNENIGRTALASLLFAVIYPITMNLFNKAKKDK